MTITGPRRERVGGWTAMVASTGFRIFFSLLYTAFVAFSLSPNQASRVYQLLFLQGGLIALLAASAYARGAHLAATGAAIGTTAKRFVRYLSLGVLGAFAVAVGLLPLGEATTQVRLGVLALMVVGAAGSALNGLLQGITVMTRGAAAAFIPALVLNLLACLVTLGIWGPQPLLLVIAVWTLPQITLPLVLIALTPELRQTLRDTGTSEANTEHFAATGIVNAASVPIAYVFRERWAAAQNSTEAAVGFLVVRFAEIGYQVLYMLLASTPQLVNRFVTRLSSGAHRFRLVLLTIPLTALGASSAIIERSWSTARFLIAECLVAPGRILCVFCLLYLLGRPSTRAYQVAVGLSALLSASLMLIPSLQESPYALQVLQAAGFIPTAVVTAAATTKRSTEGRI